MMFYFFFENWKDTGSTKRNSEFCHKIYVFWKKVVENVPESWFALSTSTFDQQKNVNREHQSHC